MTNPTPGPLDLSNVQGDVLLGFTKKAEIFFFFTIAESVGKFQVQLKKILPFIKTSEDTKQLKHDVYEHKHKKSPGLLPVVQANIAFSKRGLEKLKPGANIGDSAFQTGMKDDRSNLQDKDNDWLSKWTNDNIDGVLFVAGDDKVRISNELQEIKDILGATVTEVLSEEGQVRPGDQDGREHFGYEDGISQPSVDGLHTSLPGQTPIQPGVILLGHPGDIDRGANRDWVLDGSIMAFRVLEQHVPEFHNFLDDHPIPIPGLPPNSELPRELLGARMVGRWPSGAPIQLSPTGDNLDLARNKNRNNNFLFANSNEKCPFVAHIRKTNPRDDLTNIPDRGGEPAHEDHSIIRRGIPFGPEVTRREWINGQSSLSRGLLFVSYQSRLNAGFQFIQQSWANNQGFVNPGTGVDPIIGQAKGQGTDTQFATGLGVTDPSSTSLTMDRWVIPRGGEYFFIPSIKTLRDVFGKDEQVAGDGNGSGGQIFVGN